MLNRTVCKYSSLLIILFTLIVFSYSCNESKLTNQTDEGEIEFEIKYLDDARSNPIILLLPRKMITQFKNNSTYSIIEGFMFRLNYITNYKQGKNATLFQIVDQKYMYLTDTASTPFGYNKNNKAKIIYTDKEKKIAGLDCKHAIAIFPNLQDTVELYYTNQINVKNPNSNNPYKEIKGVLLEFSVKMTGIHMQFIAKKVSKKDINSALFEIPTGYNLVTKEEMEHIVNEFNKVADK